MTSYYWTGPGGFTSDEENPVRPNATLAMAGNYTLTITDFSGCGNASATTNVLVSPCGAGGRAIPAFPSIYIGMGAALAAGVIAYLMRRMLVRRE